MKFDPRLRAELNLIQFDLVWSKLVQFDPIWSSLIQFDPIWSKAIYFNPIWSNISNMIQFDQNKTKIYKCLNPNPNNNKNNKVIPRIALLAIKNWFFFSKNNHFLFTERLVLVAGRMGCSTNPKLLWKILLLRHIVGYFHSWLGIFNAQGVPFHPAIVFSFSLDFLLNPFWDNV